LVSEQPFQDFTIDAGCYGEYASFVKTAADIAPFDPDAFPDDVFDQNPDT